MLRRRKTQLWMFRPQNFLPEPFSIEFTIYYYFLKPRLWGNLNQIHRLEPIDKRYSLSEVPEAIRYLKGKHAQNKSCSARRRYG